MSQEPTHGEAPKHSFLGFKIGKPSISTLEPSQVHIPSFKAKNSSQELILEMQPTTLQEHPMQEKELSQKAPLVSQDDEVMWIPQWNLSPGCQMPSLFKDTSLVSEQRPVVNELSFEEEERMPEVSMQSDDCDRMEQQREEVEIDAQPKLLVDNFEELPLLADDEEKTMPLPMAEGQSEQKVHHQQEVDVRGDSILLFDRLPSFVEQNDQDVIIATSVRLQQLEEIDPEDMLIHELDLIFEEEASQCVEDNQSLGGDFLEHIIGDLCMDPDCKEPVIPRGLQDFDSFDEPLACLKEEDDSPLSIDD